MDVLKYVSHKVVHRDLSFIKLLYVTYKVFCGRLKSQSLTLAVNFNERTVVGTTVLSASLSVPLDLGRVFQTPPPPDLASSGLCVPLQCPPSNICTVTAVEVGGLPAAYRWVREPQVRGFQGPIQ